MTSLRSTMSSYLRYTITSKEGKSDKDKKSTLAKRRVRASKAALRNRSSAYARRLTYDQQNVRNTSQIPGTQRSYGLMKTTQASTPFPKATPTLDESVIRLRLEAEQLKHGSQTPLSRSYREQPSELNLIERNLEDDFDSTDSTILTSTDSRLEFGVPNVHRAPERATSDLSFALRRRRFDEAEYTIAKGRKMGQNVQLEMEELVECIDTSPLHKAPGSYFAYFYDLEKMCRNLNIKVAKGYEF